MFSLTPSYQIAKLVDSLLAEKGTLLREPSGEGIAGRLNTIEREIRILERALKVLARYPRTKAAHPSRGRFQPGSMMQLAQHILYNMRRPMHVDEIVESMRDRGKVITRNALTSRIHKLVKARQVFYQPRPATYGLIDWRNTPLDKIRAVRKPK